MVDAETIERLFDEGPVPLSELAALAARSVATLTRWCRFGHRGVFMEHIPSPDGFRSTAPALARFLAACSPTAPPVPQTERQRSRASAAARREVERLCGGRR